MKKRRKILAILLAGVMFCSAGGNVIAADKPPEQTDSFEADGNAKESENTSEVPVENETSGDTDVREDTESTGEDKTGNNSQMPEESLDKSADGVVDESGPVQENEEENFTGWETDENGHSYYYVNGEMLSEQIYMIDGVWYCFTYEGWMLRDGTGYAYDKDGIWHTYLASADGSLISGWYNTGYSYWYFSDDNYARYEDTIYEVDGALYYADGQGNRLESDSILYNGILYEADENGVLTEVKDVTDGWRIVSGSWYYYESGAPVKSEMRNIDGADYYFDYNGRMAIGYFYYSEYIDNEWEEGYKFAETNGHVLNSTEGWYASGGFWYYFKSAGWLANNEFLTINGAKYYFEWNCQMVCGAFSRWEDDEYKDYIAGADGVVQDASVTGWVYSSAWYYFKKPNVIAKEEMLTVDGQTYYFDWNGKMQTGKFNVGSDWYFAAAGGQVLKNQWIYKDGHYYYASADGKLYINGIYTIGSKKYSFDYNGMMEVGYLWKYNSETGEQTGYITDASGAIQDTEGWKYCNLKWYYTDSNGKICTNQWINSHYYVGYDGIMAVGNMFIDGIWYYFDDNGYCQANISSFTGWRYADGTWFYHEENGGKFTGWVDNKFYIVNGVMITNSAFEIEGKHYYFQYDGSLIGSGWYNITHGSSMWIYVKEDGTLANNEWKVIGGKWYYFDDIYAASGTCFIDGSWQCFNKDCSWITPDRGDKYIGWKYLNTGWYYFNEDGELLKGVDKADINGTTYYFDSYTGRMKTDCVIYNEDNIALYVDGNGYAQKMTQGWHSINGNWFYIMNDGTFAEGPQAIDGLWYYFSNGQMRTGNVYVYDWGGEYFFGSSGAWQPVSTGWYSDGHEWYYYVDGIPVSYGIHRINGIDYMFSNNGRMVTGRWNDSIYSDSGVRLTNSWYYETGAGYWYYVNAYGGILTGQQSINGKTYWFDQYGIWMK